MSIDFVHILIIVIVMSEAPQQVMENFIPTSMVWYAIVTKHD